MGNNIVNPQNFGEWLQVIGTLLSSIAVTPTEKLDQEERTALNLLGNTLQAAGSAIEVEGPWWTETNLANELQAVGSLAEVYAIVLPLSPRRAISIEIGGNLTQAVGSGIAFVDPSQQGVLNQPGNLLQTIGTVLQAIAGKYQLQALDNPDENLEGTGNELNIAGNWIQFVGSLLSALDDGSGQQT